MMQLLLERSLIFGCGGTRFPIWVLAMGTINASKTCLVIKEEFQSEADAIFGDTQVKITCEGHPHLGAPLGSPEYSLVPRLLFTERENSLVNCLYRFGSNILKSL